jgi:hypothetical protein
MSPRLPDTTVSAEPAHVPPQPSREEPRQPWRHGDPTFLVPPFRHFYEPAPAMRRPSGSKSPINLGSMTCAGTAHGRCRTRKQSMKQPGYSEPVLPFPLGLLAATPGALKVLKANGVIPMRLIARHSLGDWGNVGPDDARANDNALHSGTRILSSYQLADGAKVWVITEADRSSTTVLLPTEY